MNLDVVWGPRAVILTDRNSRDRSSAYLYDAQARSRVGMFGPYVIRDEHRCESDVGPHQLEGASLCEEPFPKLACKLRYA